MPSRSMLCDFCKQNTATVHVTQIVAGQSRELHLCAQCSKAQGLDDPTGHALAELLGDWVPTDAGVAGPGGSETSSRPGITMKDFLAAARQATTCDEPVLIMGELGTERESIARLIHDRSSRRLGPFSAVSCAGIPEAALRSELFGHEKGSFTGAHVQRKGRIETTAGGILFVDEIDRLPPALQIRLLRFLQDKTFERLGGRTSIEADTRVIAGTSADPREAMEAGRFREDLFYRLSVLVIRVPPIPQDESPS